MRASDILRRLLATCSKQVHAARFAAVLVAVDGLIRAGRASLTHIGRALGGRTSPKHSIKRIDRLLGNPRLQLELPTWYASIAQRLITMRRPVILIDWTQLNGDWYALCATLPFVGRSVPLYSEVHPASNNGNSRLVDRFLRRVQSLLPDDARPIIVADAGFCRPFFESCFDCGFDFVVRVRGGARLRGWLPDISTTASELAARAGRRAHSVGEFAVYDANRRGPTLQVVIAKKPRHAPRFDDAYYKRATQAWVLATSLRQALAHEVVALYALRMQIEETFRDAKNPRFGWALGGAANRSAERLQTLLLLTALAMIAVMLVGLDGERRGLSRRLQANTTHHRRVLSIFRVGFLLLASSTEMRR